MTFLLKFTGITLVKIALKSAIFEATAISTTKHLPFEVVGDAVIGDPIIGDPVIGDPVIGDPVVGDAVVAST